MQGDFFDALDQGDLWPRRWIDQPACIARDLVGTRGTDNEDQHGVCVASQRLQARKVWVNPAVVVSGPVGFVGGSRYGWQVLIDRGLCGRRRGASFLRSVSSVGGWCMGRAAGVGSPDGASPCHVGNNCTDRGFDGPATTAGWS